MVNRTDWPDRFEVRAQLERADNPPLSIGRNGNLTSRYERGLTVRIQFTPTQSANTDGGRAG
jgi:hypothetical protein